MRNGCNWLEPSGICDQLKFYPDQIKFISLLVKKKSDKFKNLINTFFFVNNHFPTNFIQILLTDEMQLQKIYKENYQNNTTWLQVNIHSNTSLRNRHLINPRVVDWYEHIIKTKLWDYREFWTCRMWVVWIFVFVLHKLITKLVCYERKKI